jgi:hypothetical protein
MNIKILTKHIAQELQSQVDNFWILRGEVTNEEIDENKNGIAVIHVNKQEEIVYHNHTYRLEGALTGQILLNSLTPDEIDQKVENITNALIIYIKALKYTEIDNCVLLEGISGNVATETDEIYFTFSIPFTVYAQF